MIAEIICIGTELLLGQIVDTNAAYLAKRLAGLGIDLFYKTTVGDNLERVTAALRQAWERADLLILSGGLGPTQDDLTREGVARLLGEELQFNEEAWGQVCAYFNKVRRPIAESNRRQAMFPKTGQIILNIHGTAPGLLVEKEQHYLIALPGVPSELTGMWEREVEPYLKKLLARENNPVLSSRVIRMVGIGESVMEERIMDLIKNQTNPTIAPYAGKGEVTLRVTAKSTEEAYNQQIIAETIARITERLGSYIYGFDGDNLETVIGRLLKNSKYSLATAESCTGGLIAHRITNIPGSSDYFLGGVNSYSNELKVKLVDVPAETIQKYGAVSSETATAMAIGIRKKTGAGIGLAVTGIAGPGGGTPEKPVGLVYFAVSSNEGTTSESRIFPFDRIGNKEASAQAALVLLWQRIHS
ncbi:MAG TPA: competence/damage-inducible protein A [Bacillota bacterium]|nr:competence/damage-inducible protein A [Bacillota bacterium]